MIELLQSPFTPVFKEFAENVKANCLICSPYITFGPIKMLSQMLLKRELAGNIQISILTDISLRTIVQGSTEIPALLYLLKNHPNTSIIYLPRIHAKVYLADGVSAVITSANFTEGGGARNFEYGIKINDAAFVQRIRNDIDEYKKLGAVVTETELSEIQSQVENIKTAIQAEQKAISQKIRLETQKQEFTTENNLIRLRVKGRSINSIFSETLLYLLAKKPMNTEELHMRIKNIHPDLCDDNFDRIIDGKHFGKLWKHQVRNAQVYLRRENLITFDKERRLWKKAK